MKTKTKRFAKLISIVLALSIILGTLPIVSVSAQEVAGAELTKESELWIPENDSSALSTEGDLSLQELEIAVLPAEDKPEIVSQAAIDEKQHVNRLWEQETDLNSIIFQNKDGTKTMYYFEEAVKYVDKNGKVKDKKNTISETASGDFTNPNNDINTYFPKKLNQNKGVEVKFGEYSIEFAPDIKGNSGASRQTGHNKNNDPTEFVEYPNVFDDGVSVRYTPTFDGYKEDIILYENTGKNAFSFKVNTNGLSLVEDEYGSYNFVNPLTGETVSRLGDLVIYDSKPFEVPDEILNESVSNPTEEDIAKKEQTLEQLISSVPLDSTSDNSSSIIPQYDHKYIVEAMKQDSLYTVTITVDEEYLNDPERVYPVYVDPTISVSGSGISKTIQDAPIYANKPSTASGGNTYNVVGYQGSTYGVGRTLMKFPGLASNSTYKNLSSNQITSLDLHIYEGSGSTNNACIDLWQYTGTTWTESTARCNNIGWDSYSNNFTWNYINCSGWQTFNLKSMVATWKGSSTALDKGIIMTNYTSEASSGYSKHFLSTESGYQPYLTFNYNSVTFNSLSLNEADSGYISQGGEYWYKFTVPECVNYRFYTTGSVDTYGELYQGSTLIVSNDDSGDGNNFSVSYTLTEGAVYKLKVRGYSSSTTGSYSVRVVANTAFDTSQTSSLKSEFNSLLGSGKKSVAHHYTPSQCIDMILEYDQHISQLCNSQYFEIPKSFVQALLMRELWCVNTGDDLADTLVESGARADSSTGYGQIFATTAIGALNNANSIGINTGMSSMDASNEDDLSDMWNDLHTDQNFNIKMVYYEVLNCANKTSQPNIYLWDYSESQIKAILARYNGTGDEAAQYGDEVYEYYLIFKEYNGE